MLLRYYCSTCVHFLKAWQMIEKCLPCFLVSKWFCPAEFPGKHQYSTSPSCCWPSALCSCWQDDPSWTHLISAMYWLFCGCSTQFYHLYAADKGYEACKNGSRRSHSKADNWLMPCLFFLPIYHQYPTHLLLCLWRQALSCVFPCSSESVRQANE